MNMRRLALKRRALKRRGSKGPLSRPTRPASRGVWEVRRAAGAQQASAWREQEAGLFRGLASDLIIATCDGVEYRERPQP
jgi:hypothetical protein